VNDPVNGSDYSGRGWWEDMKAKAGQLYNDTKAGAAALYNDIKAGGGQVIAIVTFGFSVIATAVSNSQAAKNTRQEPTTESRRRAGDAFNQVNKPLPPQKPLYIKSAEWTPRNGHMTLSVVPTDYGRSNAREDLPRAFNEVLQLSNSSYSQKFYNQFVCHADYPGLVLAANKESWNLDDNTADANLFFTTIQACNPKWGF
jgi:hypothetical protein